MGSGSELYIFIENLRHALLTTSVRLWRLLHCRSADYQGIYRRLSHPLLIVVWALRLTEFATSNLKQDIKNAFPLLDSIYKMNQLRYPLDIIQMVRPTNSGPDKIRIFWIQKHRCGKSTRRRTLTITSQYQHSRNTETPSWHGLQTGPISEAIPSKRQQLSSESWRIPQTSYWKDPMESKLIGNRQKESKIFPRSTGQCNGKRESSI